MEKNTSLKVFGGVVAGAALAIAAAAFLRSKQGKKLTKNMQTMLQDFYDYLAPELKKIKNFTKEEYEKFVEDGAKKYGEMKKLSQDKVKELIGEAKNSWKQFSKEFK